MQRIFTCCATENFSKVGETILLAPFSYLIVERVKINLRYSTPSPTSGFHIREAINNILCINTHKKLFCLFPFFPFLGAEKREREIGLC